MIRGIRTKVRIYLPLEKVRSALLMRGWPWLGRPGLEGTREIELPATMHRLKVVPLEVTGLGDRVFARLEVHGIGQLHTSQIKGDIVFQANGFTVTAVFNGSAAAEALRGSPGQDVHRVAFDLATAVLTKIAHDLELSQLAGFAGSSPNRPTSTSRNGKENSGGDR